MANPIAGTNAGRCNWASGTNYSGGQAVVDATGTYAYVQYGLGNTTAIGFASAGQTLPQTTITLLSNSNFQTGGGSANIQTSAGTQIVSYTGLSGGTQLTGCSGGTGVMSYGGLASISPGIAKIQLSNLSLVNLNFAQLPLLPPTWANNITFQCMFMDTVNGILFACAAQSASSVTQIWSVTTAGGTMQPVCNAPTNIVTGNTCNFFYDSVSGIVWEPTSNHSQIYGFYYNDPTGVNSNFTPVTHPYQSAGTNSCNPVSLAVLRNNATVPANRWAFAVPSSVSYPGVYRWRDDQYRVEVLADNVGATNGTSNVGSAFSFGTAIANPYGIAYDGSGRLYVLQQTLSNPCYYIGTNEITVTQIASSLTNDGPLDGPPIYLASGGFSGVGNGQLVYSTAHSLYIAY